MIPLRKKAAAHLVIDADGEFSVMGAEEFEKLVPKYTLSRMYRFMLDMARLAQFPTDNFNFVELVKDSGADFYTTIAEFDEQLYKYYGFGAAQIEFIERRYPYDDGCGAI